MGRTLEINLIDGSADGRYIISEMYKSSITYKIPKDKLGLSAELDYIATPGIYLLFGKDAREKFVYVGEAEDVYKRLSQHTPDKDNYLWDEALVFVSSKKGDLDKARIKYLENRLYNLIAAHKNYLLKNRNEPSKSVLSAATEETLENIILDIKQITEVLGYKLFTTENNPKRIKANLPTNSGQTAMPKKVTEPLTKLKQAWYIFYLKEKGVNAKCIVDTNGDYIVTAGSVISKEVTKSLPDKLKKMRKTAVKQGKIKANRLTEDISFKSASTAAKFVVGYSINGRKAWKDGNGRELGEVLA